jgi:hypothetical protein
MNAEHAERRSEYAEQLHLFSAYSPFPSAYAAFMRFRSSAGPPIFRIHTTVHTER